MRQFYIIPRLLRSMSKQYVTLAQAQRRLPHVKKLLSQALHHKNMLHMALSVDLQYEDELEDSHFDTKFHKEFHRLSYDFYQILETLEKKGVLIRDLDSGLIDFISFHNNREICLCFRLGEEKITHWHEVDAGFTGRRPIEELKRVLS